MTKRASRPLLNRLLSGREGLSTPDKEEVLAKVLGERAARPTWWSRPSFRITALLLATSAVIALVWVQQPGSTQSDFTPRGDPNPSFELSCLNAGIASTCREGSAVAFRLATPGPAYFSAFTLTAEGAALWYFSNVDTRQPRTDGVLELAPVLGAQPAGEVVVIGVFASEPIEKATLRERLSQGDTRLKVIRRTLTVGP